MFTTESIATTPLNYSLQNEQRSRWLSQLGELIAFPTVSALPQHRHDLKACAQWLARHLAEIGLHHVQILPGVNKGAPSIYADWLLAPEKPTLLLYGHYDVQPVDPLKEWRTLPFKATIVNDNLYGRGASDDKGQFFIHLKAVESYLRTTGRLPINVKIWLEGEEEIGSPNLSAFFKREIKRLQANAVLVSDTEMLGKGRPSIIYGLRGNLNCELEVRGPLGSFADDWRSHLRVIDQIVRFPNVYTDTSGVRRFDYLVEAVKRGSARKILFGSDGPWLHPALELQKVRLLGLPPRQEELVLGNNLIRLL
jgi:hypothetical protein